MPKEYLRVFLTKGTRCLNVETKSAYAIKDNKKNVFIPKKHSKLLVLINNEHYRWALDIPIWMAVKYDEVASAITYIQDLNEWRENQMTREQEIGLDIIKNYLKNG